MKGICSPGLRNAIRPVRTSSESGITSGPRPGDRILTGYLRNDSVRRVLVDLPDVRVLARNGDRVAASPVFLNTFGKQLWSPGRGPNVMPDSELVRTGRIAFLKPGQQVPFTVAWHAKDGEPAVVDYGAGSLRVPG